MDDRCCLCGNILKMVGALRRVSVPFTRTQVTLILDSLWLGNGTLFLVLSFVLDSRRSGESVIRHNPKIGTVT